ncbi:hypothetical protein WR25_06515 [Diploscapter pachys]|uniref:Cytochrome ubiquinol oxidase subunit I n=1 Tax=Diploscapter pachys TaxID=2018661 RepID=A0A2A2JX31_9BILA|nr:hypothetical protein WR25_06515 [Diploscapter pachys]
MLVIENLDPVILARAQFAFTVSFHFIFPAFSIGTASYLMVLEGLWLKTGSGVYANLYRYWLKIFAVAFGMGVVSGVVMSYQFGTNWSVFSAKAGPVIGPLMAYEVLTAFFLEAGFLGVMLFGINKVGRGPHFFATCMVAVGTLISATWIISVNSWMQTPAGYAINAKGQFVPAGSWLPIIFNASFPYRLVHTVIGAYLTTAMVVGAVGAWHLLRDRANPGARKMFSMAIPEGASLILFGLPSNKDAVVHGKIEIPYLGSLILKHDPKAPLPGLNDFPRDRWPPTPIVFWSFRIMVAMGLAMLGLGLWSLLARWRGKLYDWRWLHRAALALGPSGFVAVIAGWVTTEVGRQPFTVYGLLRTAESHSPLAAPAVAASLVAFILVYFGAFGAGTYYLLRMMAKPPAAGEPEPSKVPQRAAGITPASGVVASTGREA